MDNHAFRVETIDLHQHSVPAQVQQCLAEAESEHPQLGLDWLLNLVQHATQAGARPVLLVAWDMAHRPCILPLLYEEDGAVSALANFYTSLYQPVGPTPDRALLLRALLRHLRKTPGITRLTLAPMDPANALFGELQAALTDTGWRGCHHYFCFGNWRHSLRQGDWDGYLASRSSRVRNTVSRKTRAFLRDGRGSLALIRPTDALDEAIESYTQIYAKSWKRNEPFTDFIPNLVRLAAEKGWLRLGLAHYDGLPIASQIWLVSGATAYIYKLAYDEDYAQQSPGTVLTAYMMQQVISQDAIRNIDYLSGDDTYKRDWMSQRREMRGVAAYNPASARGVGALLAYTVKRGLKYLHRPATSSTRE
ncbi:MAG: GNAT family N-acetyltransferase [Gammaproteobacteria bacterium]|nr:GNAT family N-acetyltransferase [Gammaproteobacteria bacterium]